MPGRALLMRILPVVVLTLTVFDTPCVSAADDTPADALLRAVQNKVVQALKEAGPCMARIYVSRSNAYSKAPYWGSAAMGEPAADSRSGELGRFDAVEARKRVPEDAPHRARVLRTIAEHDLSDPKAIPESYGSGMVVDKGLVLTCAHVVRDATRVYVRLPGKGGSWANVHASDPRSDLAVLRMLDPPDGMTALSLGKGENARKGQFVIGVANNFSPRFRADDDPVASHGVITALRREASQPQVEHSRRTLHQYGTLLQVDARTSPGCSGGALLDLDGKAVGITTTIAVVTSTQPVGVIGRFPGMIQPRPRRDAVEATAAFAIPFNANTRRIIEVLKRGEEVEYGFLGVQLPQEDGRVGVYLQGVTAGSPAAEAGLRSRDVIRAINGAPINDSSDVFLNVGMALAGSVVEIEVIRDNRPLSVRATLAKYHVVGHVVAAKRPPARFGLRVDYSSVLAQRNAFIIRWPAKGVAIREVVPGSAADKARLQPDRIITHVNGRVVVTPAEYYKEVTRPGKKVELTYLNSDGRSEQLTLEEK